MNERFEAEVINRLTTIEGGLAQLLRKPAAAPAESSSVGKSRFGTGPGRKPHLSGLRTMQFQIIKVWDDRLPGTNTPKWNVDVFDAGGAKRKLGTFQKDVSDVCKEAVRSREVLSITWGFNSKGFPEIHDIL
jgi:hypothetical protein